MPSNSQKRLSNPYLRMSYASIWFERANYSRFKSRQLWSNVDHHWDRLLKFIGPNDPRAKLWSLWNLQARFSRKLSVEFSAKFQSKIGWPSTLFAFHSPCKFSRRRRSRVIHEANSDEHFLHETFSTIKRRHGRSSISGYLEDSNFRCSPTAMNFKFVLVPINWFRTDTIRLIALWPGGAPLEGEPDREHCSS